MKTVYQFLMSLTDLRCETSLIPKCLDPWTDRDKYTTYYKDNKSYLSADPEHVKEANWNCANQRYMET